MSFVISICLILQISVQISNVTWTWMLALYAALFSMALSSPALFLRQVTGWSLLLLNAPITIDRPRISTKEFQILWEW